MSKIAIVGAGVTGLATAYYLSRNNEHELVLFEAARPGGVVRTETHDECLFETGPETYQARVPLLQQISRELGIEEQLVKAGDQSNARYLIKDGRLTKIPRGPVSFLFNSVMFITHKIRALLALRRRFSVWQGMSVFDASRTIFGEPFAQYFASAMARGVFGCEAQDLELAGAFPDIYKAMNEEPTLLKAVKKASADRRAFWEEKLGDSAWHGFEKGLYSYKEGLQTLTDALRQRLKDDGTRFEAVRISRIDHKQNQYQLAAGGQKYEGFDRVIITCGPSELARIVRDFDKDFSNKLGEAQYSPLTVVVQAWDRKNFSQSGFGVLCPRKENLPMLGTLFTSNLFPGRAPKNLFLTKTMVGGDHGLFKDDELENMATEGLRRIFKIKHSPAWSKIYRHDPGLPRYFPGYSKWKEEVDTMVEKHSGLHLLGWFYTGIGLSHSLESAYKFADELD